MIIPSRHAINSSQEDYCANVRSDNSLPFDITVTTNSDRITQSCSLKQNRKWSGIQKRNIGS